MHLSICANVIYMFFFTSQSIISQCNLPFQSIKGGLIINIPPRGAGWKPKGFVHP